MKLLIMLLLALLLFFFIAAIVILIVFLMGKRLPHWLRRGQSAPKKIDSPLKGMKRAAGSLAKCRKYRPENSNNI